MHISYAYIEKLTAASVCAVFCTVKCAADIKYGTIFTLAASSLRCISLLFNLAPLSVLCVQLKPRKREFNYMESREGVNPYSHLLPSRFCPFLTCFHTYRIGNVGLSQAAKFQLYMYLQYRLERT